MNDNKFELSQFNLTLFGHIACFEKKTGVLLHIPNATLSMHGYCSNKVQPSTDSRMQTHCWWAWNVGGTKKHL